MAGRASENAAYEGNLLKERVALVVFPALFKAIPGRQRQ
jgi:hypothetical protein